MNELQEALNRIGANDLRGAHQAGSGRLVFTRNDGDFTVMLERSLRPELAQRIEKSIRLILEQDRQEQAAEKAEYVAKRQAANLSQEGMVRGAALGSGPTPPFVAY